MSWHWPSYPEETIHLLGRPDYMAGISGCRDIFAILKEKYLSVSLTFATYVHCLPLVLSEALISLSSHVENHSPLSYILVDSPNFNHQSPATYRCALMYSCASFFEA